MNFSPSLNNVQYFISICQMGFFTIFFLIYLFKSIDISLETTNLHISYTMCSVVIFRLERKIGEEKNEINSKMKRDFFKENIFCKNRIGVSFVWNSLIERKIFKTVKFESAEILEKNEKWKVIQFLTSCLVQTFIDTLNIFTRKRSLNTLINTGSTT